MTSASSTASREAIRRANLLETATEDFALDPESLWDDLILTYQRETRNSQEPKDLPFWILENISAISIEKMLKAKYDRSFSNLHCYVNGLPNLLNAERWEIVLFFRGVLTQPGAVTLNKIVKAIPSCALRDVYREVKHVYEERIRTTKQGEVPIGDPQFKLRDLRAYFDVLTRTNGADDSEDEEDNIVINSTAVRRNDPEVISIGSDEDYRHDLLQVTTFRREHRVERACRSLSTRTSSHLSNAPTQDMEIRHIAERESPCPSLSGERPTSGDVRRPDTNEIDPDVLAYCTAADEFRKAKDAMEELREKLSRRLEQYQEKEQAIERRIEVLAASGQPLLERMAESWSSGHYETLRNHFEELIELSKKRRSEDESLYLHKAKRVKLEASSKDIVSEPHRFLESSDM